MPDRNPTPCFQKNTLSRCNLSSSAQFDSNIILSLKGTVFEATVKCSAPTSIFDTTTMYTKFNISETKLITVKR
jgi:hypothetical protein